VKKGWEIKTLGDICTFRPPKSEARERLGANDPVSFVPMSELGINQKYFLAKETTPLSQVAGSYTYFADGDVLLAKITPCFENGKLGVADGLTNGVGFGSSEFFVIRPGHALDKEFLYYFLSQPAVRQEGQRCMGGAVGQQRVPKEYLESLTIPVPPLPEQRRIVAILDEAFEGIAAAKANAEKNLRNAKEAFVAALEQQCGCVQEGWQETTVGQAADEGIIAKPFDGNHGEIHPKRADYTPSGVPFVMACDLKNGEVDTHNCTFISPRTAERLRVGRATHGDVLLSHKGTIGRTAVLSTSDDYVMLTPQVTAYRVLDQSRLLNEFLYYYFRSHFFQQTLAAAAADGSTRAYVGITKQRGLPLRIPPLNQQKRIIHSLAKIDVEVAQIEQMLARKPPALDELKASLLHQAFSGNL